ncbi:hypothetical protein CO172_03420 [Candidatus Uhrbacteria bacterium CG_4_9_14_3_um_filter_36_7]|uniref:Uncharacterized protein n=1 Tax=Candidatus Uhrbacteria bacterium CG_4_9_14_3_um_filter_36_7 TaxID=1975033 RepID=A0A2M7XGH5_9BACT|nr:MAG: hypothetical protein CO172_03420 [Candidatus Uhrbacteria bacterium CG_4_9_14_3_um_filter_36_7]
MKNVLIISPEGQIVPEWITLCIEQLHQVFVDQIEYLTLHHFRDRTDVRKSVIYQLRSFHSRLNGSYAFEKTKVELVIRMLQ